MSELIPCPIDGCDYAAETEQSVRGHVSGKKDSDHSGHTYDELTALLETGGSGSGSGSGKNLDQENSSSDSGGPEFPTNPDASDSSGCPECGSDDWYAASELKAMLDNPPAALDSYERVCANCREAYNA